MATPYDRRWRAIRLAILARDGYRCQIRLAGCTTKATQADHIVPLVLGGARLDPLNLRAACAHCNASSGASDGNRLREPRTPW